jgi:protein gp37
MAKRLQAMRNEKYKKGFELSLHPTYLKTPYTWKKPRYVFVNSMSDLFHEQIPLQFVQGVFKVMNDNPTHTFQILTKRSEILLEYCDHLSWSKNIWLGVTVESQEYIQRIRDISKVKAAVRFVSFEPLLGKINRIPLAPIDWVIVGGESGPGARPMEGKWVQSIKKQCIQKEIPFFFKQWGGVNKKKNGRLLEGVIWDQMPLNELVKT